MSISRRTLFRHILGLGAVGVAGAAARPGSYPRAYHPRGIEEIAGLSRLEGETVKVVASGPTMTATEVIERRAEFFREYERRIRQVFERHA